MDWLDHMRETLRTDDMPAPKPCCRCCEAAMERGELDHILDHGCPYPPCDYCAPRT